MNYKTYYTKVIRSVAKDIIIARRVWRSGQAVNKVINNHDFVNRERAGDVDALIIKI